MSAELSTGFAPILGEEAAVLVLGTLPSMQSFAVNQYYGNPRNAFWSIVERLAGEKFSLSYDERLDSIRSLGIALWDVYRQAEREGSLDSNIVSRNATMNDFSEILSRDHIKLVACNGAAAYKAFNQVVDVDTLADQGIKVEKLPSTSPAFAAMSFEDKFAIWQEVLTPHLRF